MAGHSNSTPVPNLDRRSIMKTAWTMYRAWFEVRNRPFKFNRSDFAVYLAAAWRMAAADRMTAKQRREASIRDQIARLAYAPSRVDVAAARTRLSAELAALA